MKSLSGKLGVILIGLAIFGYSEGISFEVYGIKSGMTKKQVKKLIEESWKGHNIEDANEYIRISSASEPSIGGIVFNLCNDKFCYFQKSFDPSMKNFIFLFNQSTGLYGKPFNSDSEIQLDSKGERREISFYWRLRSDTVQVRYIIFPTNDQLDLIYFTEDWPNKMIRK